MAPKIGIYGLTGCGGDQLTILNCEDKLVDMFALANIQSFVMAKSDNIEGDMDLALVEGSVSTKEQEEHLKDVRERAKILIAIGNCACYGGPQAAEYGLGNWEESFKEIYGDVETEHTVALEPKPLSDYVEVDYCLPGCPIDKYEFMALLARLLHGISPDDYPLPVCAECKWKQNHCLLLEGKICLGPITQAGCDAVCPGHNIGCVGCRGPVKGANFASEIDMLLDMGYDKEDIINRMRMYGGSKAAEMLKKAFEERGDEE